MSVVGDNLTLLRLDRRYSRDDIESILGISKYTLRNWERGRVEPSIKYLIKLSTLFQISIDEIVGNKEIEKENIHDIEKFNMNKKILEQEKIEKENKKKATD